MAKYWPGTTRSLCRSRSCRSASAAGIRTSGCIEEIPVKFVLFDLLYHDGELLLDQPLSNGAAG